MRLLTTTTTFFNSVSIPCLLLVAISLNATSWKDSSEAVILFGCGFFYKLLCITHYIANIFFGQCVMNTKVVKWLKRLFSLCLLFFSVGLNLQLFDSLNYTLSQQILTGLLFALFHILFLNFARITKPCFCCSNMMKERSFRWQTA